MAVAGLLRARHVGIRELKDHLSELMEAGKPLVATDHGNPKYFLVPYGEMAELIEMMDELSDAHVISQVKEAREEYRAGKWKPVSGLWKQLGKRTRGRAVRAGK